MNNTKTTTLAAIFIAATLVAAGTLATTTHSAFAYEKKKGEEGSKNGNTVTAQINKQKAYQSGFDNLQTQDAENVICTHPASSATCKAVAVSNQTGGGGGGVCNSPLVEAHVGTATGVVICVDPSDLTEPGSSGKCTGSGVITVIVDGKTLCLSV
jgi:hypothetical protein